MSDHREEPAADKPLADALLAIDGRAPASFAEARQVAEKALRRTRRWVRVLTAMTVGFMLLMIVGIGLSAWFCYFKLAPAKEKIHTDIVDLGRQLQDYKAKNPQLDLLATTAGITAGTGYTSILLHAITLWGISALLAVMLAAAVCTVLLVMASRRAALRQIQLGLLVLSEQFDALQRSLHGGSFPGGGATARAPGA
jgi:hypothetical protein